MEIFTVAAIAIVGPVAPQAVTLDVSAVADVDIKHLIDVVALMRGERFVARVRLEHSWVVLRAGVAGNRAVVFIAFHRRVLRGLRDFAESGCKYYQPDFSRWRRKNHG